MNKNNFGTAWWTAAISLFLFFGCSEKERIVLRMVTSPSQTLSMKVQEMNGKIFYTLNKGGKEVLHHSRLGLGMVLDGSSTFDSALTIIDAETSSVDTTWEQVWGEQRLIRNNYQQLKIKVESADKKRLDIVFRLYDDGLGFRYEFPKQATLDSFKIMDELTEFKLAEDAKAWSIPAMEGNRYEFLYKPKYISAVDTFPMPMKWHTPLTMKSKSGLYLSFHEAALTDYASMAIDVMPKKTLKCHLVPWQDGVAVYGKAPFVSPWRTIAVEENAGDLMTNYLVLNLNEPNKLENTDWVQPGKYVGIWWALHIDKFTFMPSEKHGATTENAIQYIDFAAKYGFPQLLIEGWNEGWVEKWWEGVPNSNFTKPFPDFDIDSVYSYAQSKGVRIIGHHETTGDIDMYESQMDDAYQFCKENNITQIKTGYVGKRLSNGEWHYGQYGVRHFRNVIETAAKYGISIIAHEVVKPTGIRRTYPNMLSRESARGMEYNAWRKGGNPPSHTVTIPFTRLLGGPMDYTPGVFDVLFNEYRPNNRVNTTLAKQLSYYVTLYSPVQMAADLPENYEGHPAFQFILDVPTDWETTKVLNAEIGEYLTVVRKDKASEDWFLGSSTNEESRDFDITLDFLDAGKTYKATIYADAKTTDFETEPMTYDISEKEVKKGNKLALHLARSGGCAIRFSPTSKSDVEEGDSHH